MELIKDSLFRELQAAERRLATAKLYLDMALTEWASAKAAESCAGKQWIEYQIVSAQIGENK